MRAAMEPWWGMPANPSSVHRAGQRAAAAVEEARGAVAALVGGRSEGIVFTSGATEGNHLAVHGAAAMAPADRRRWVVSPIEHPCVHAAVARLERGGWTVERLPVGRDGVVRVPDRLPPDTAGISLMAANHETGVVQPVQAAVAAARAVGAFVHVDATQAVGKLALDYAGVDAVVISGHKLGGPPGIGAVILRDGDPFPPLLGGGAQERGRRAGTVPTALVVGLGTICGLIRKREAATPKVWGDLIRIPDPVVSEAGGSLAISRGADPQVALEGSLGSEASGSILPGHALYVFPGLRGAQIVQALDVRGICVSSGAACASGSVEPSPVLTAMGHPHPESGVRISLGWSSTRADVEALAAVLGEVVEGVRLAAAWE